MGDKAQVANSKTYSGEQFGTNIDRDNGRGPLVSVYLPTWNRGEVAVQAARSVLSQSWRNIELIIVDDASKPGTRLCLEQLEKTDPRVLLVVNEINRGACYSRNAAIAMAQGEFITGLDDDDRFLPKRIETFLDHWRDTDSYLYADDIFDFGGHQKCIRKKSTADLDRLLSYNCIGNQVFTKTAYMREAGGFDTSLISAQDYDLWMRLTLRRGSGRRVPGATQVVERSEAVDRISTSSTTWRGYWITYRKHAHMMNRTQRKNRLFAIVMVRGNHFSLRRAIVLLTRNNAREFIRWVLSR